MDDSFFGFDTSVPLEDDGGGGRIAEPSEEEYDALNDETFGSAINGDWEEAHESMVRLGSDLESVQRNVHRTGGDAPNNRSGAGFRNFLSSAPSSGGSTPALLNSHLRNARNIADSDLELNISSMRLDDVDIAFDDNGSLAAERLNMDPAVWASHTYRQQGEQHLNGLMSNNQHIFRENFRSPFQPQQPQIKPETNANFGLPPLPPGPKITTLEDIERNIIIQQTMQQHLQQHQQLHLQQQQQQQQLQQQQQQLQQHQKHRQLENKIIDESVVNRQQSGTPVPFTQQQLQLQKHSQIVNQHKAPPGFHSQQTSPPRPNLNFANNMAQHPLNNVLPPQQQQQSHQQQHPNGVAPNRLPPGFPLYPPGLPQTIAGPHLPPHPLLNQHGVMPPNFPLGNQRPLPNPHLPTALNNFAMHPSFNAMRAAAAGLHPAALIPTAQQPRLPPHPLQAANNLLNQQPNSMYNMFNMRLVQEIQQNHPLLQNSAAVRQHQQLSQQQQQVRSTGGVLGVKQQQQHNRRIDGIASNGNLPQDEFDNYANLMSTRDKHWLIGIQLSQLNTDTPFIDDYYFTVYKERKALRNGDTRQSQAHKDNQLNHPLTQPRGHAQLILVQLGNKNGTRNGQHRERRSSENNSNSTGNNNSSSGHDQKLPYVFTPLKFENSLGKLQYGSVTAPRKIIDAEIMGSDANSEPGASQQNNSNANNSQSKSVGMSTLLTAVAEVTPSNLRKSRHILLHIETLYRYLLKLEDLENPNAMATIIMKKKKESERIAALEQLENANKTPEERAAEAANPQAMNPALKNKFTYEIEPKDALVSNLIAGLTYDKVVAMMNVRKGKVLLRRIMPFIADQGIRWNVWIGVFSALQNVIKKDREDVDGVLYALYPEFKTQIKKANFETLVEICTSITMNDHKLIGIFYSRFGILSLVCLILRSEDIFAHSTDTTLNAINKGQWSQFLALVSSSLNRTIQNQTISAAIEPDSIQPMMNHFARFKDLKLDSLLALITEAAKQQID